MRYGIPLISLGILIIFLGFISFPFHLTMTIYRNFTLPPWIHSASIKVNSGNFTIYVFNKSGNLVEINNASKGYSKNFNDTFIMYGLGNATVTLYNMKLFYTTAYKYISYDIIAVGVEIEIIQTIYNRHKNNRRFNIKK
ncbi:hypothetical protein DFR86_03820 [Acidianus sulfidivorans JP7]|uniref:Uncharacterized protein n=1 Tax=Acidianus sulfidivorans JP7 TaxID=619593 RepID=A0A2U9IL71_9CREN|nr:hypothetical protein [Acidianus sulfidivorans]AWR96767.1 hypothetical protein DFR86_03820 [Acidianus sulfidivorans JP7]